MVNIFFHKYEMSNSDEASTEFTRVYIENMEEDVKKSPAGFKYFLTS